MNKGKSTFVTALIAVMLGVIDIGLFRLYTPGFYILSGLFAAYGFIHGMVDFRRWLCKNTTLHDLKPVIFPAEIEAPKKKTKVPQKEDLKPKEPVKVDEDIIDAVLKELNGAEKAAEA